jgi:hypothetical protein
VQVLVSAALVLLAQEPDVQEEHRGSLAELSLDDELPGHWACGEVQELLFQGERWVHLRP